MRSVIFLCRGLFCSAWNKYLLHEGALPNELCQDTTGRVTLKPSLPLDYQQCCSSRPCPRVEWPKPECEPELCSECSRLCFKKPHCDHREKQQHGMLKQNGNERFYHSFFFPPMCQKPTPPTGREMNSHSTVIPESPLLFPIKTFLCLCSFFPPSGGLGVGQ